MFFKNREIFMGKWKKPLGVAFFLVVSGLGIFSCQNQDRKAPEAVASPGVTDTQILIGTSAALTDFAQFYGVQYLHGALSYINAVNDRGGVHGRKIRLLAMDDKYSPAQAVGNTLKLIQDYKVFALFNYVGTPTSVKIIDIVHAAKIPALGFLTGAEELRSPDRPYLFHVRDSYYAEAEGAVSYFVDKLGLRKVAVVYQEDAFGLAGLSGFQLSLARRGLEPVVTGTYKRGSTDLTGAFEMVRSKDVEVVMMVGLYAPFIKFIELCQQAGAHYYLYAGSYVGAEAFSRGLQDDPLLKLSREDYEKIIVTQIVPSPLSPDLAAAREYREFLLKYYPQDDPNFVSFEGFINAKVLVQALRLTGRDLSRERFMATLASMVDYDVGIGKNISYGPSDTQGITGIFYTHLGPDGQFYLFDPAQEKER